MRVQSGGASVEPDTATSETPTPDTPAREAGLAVLNRLKLPGSLVFMFPHPAFSSVLMLVQDMVSLDEGWQMCCIDTQPVHDQ